MGSHFHDWIDYSGVAFSIALLEWGRTFSDFWGKAWFSLAHNHKHKDIRTRRMAYLTLDTSSPQSNDKQDDGRSVHYIAFQMFA